MPARLEGYITIDASDYQDEIEIHADADDIAQIMDDNNIDMDEMMEYFDVKPDITLSSISHYIQDCMHDDLIRIVNACMNRLMADYNLTFNKLVESRREADQFKAEGKVLTGGPHVSEVRPSS
jgi:glycine/serine hydroxymethyltransferase